MRLAERMCLSSAADMEEGSVSGFSICMAEEASGVGEPATGWVTWEGGGSIGLEEEARDKGVFKRG